MRPGELESELTRVLIAFLKQSIGRGPVESKAYLAEDVVILRGRGILSEAERSLLQPQPTDRLRDHLKQIKREAIEWHRAILERQILEVVQRSVYSLHHDLSTVRDEIVVVVMLNGKVPTKTSS